MNNGDLGGLGLLLASASAAIVWLGGETGKIVIAGGLGGLTRWLASERRRMRDGLLSARPTYITGVPPRMMPSKQSRGYHVRHPGCS